MKKTAALFIVLFSISSFAGSGKEVGNGGDLCEDRIKIIRDDLKTWIEGGGPAGLKLPFGVSTLKYISSMQTALASASIGCTSQVIKVGAKEKTCKNYFDKSNHAQILCNHVTFSSSSETDQYTLIHHEFAGLAGLEKNSDEGSNYVISNQISGFLTDQVVKKLAVKPPPAGNPSISTKSCPYLELAGNYESKNVVCTNIQNKPLPLSEVAAYVPLKVKISGDVNSGDLYFETASELASSFGIPRNGDSGAGKDTSVSVLQCLNTSSKKEIKFTSDAQYFITESNGVVVMKYMFLELPDLFYSCNATLIKIEDAQ